MLLVYVKKIPQFCVRTKENVLFLKFGVTVVAIICTKFASGIVCEISESRNSLTFNKLACSKRGNPLKAKKPGNYCVPG